MKITNYKLRITSTTRKSLTVLRSCALTLLRSYALTVFFLLATNVLTAQTWPPAGGLPGDGLSAATAWEISTPEHLAALASYVNAGNGNATQNVYWKMTADIDLASYLANGGAGYNGGLGWNPIGNYSTANGNTSFQGNFDGDGFVIKNLIINRPIENNAANNIMGLFGVILGANITNLGIESGNITGYNYVGSLIASAGQPASNITNCFSLCNVSGYQNVGGLCGNLYYKTVENCYATGNITGRDYVGGLVGQNGGNCTIANCYASGNVIGTGSGAGGLVGYNNTALIRNSYATGNVNGSDLVGGIAGRSTDGANTIRNCVAANLSITGNSGSTNRVSGYSSFGGHSTNLQNNYAYESMLINDLPVSSTNSNSFHGANATMSQLKSFAFYTNNSLWNNQSYWSIASTSSATAIWRICEEDVLLPWLQWQGYKKCPLVPVTDIINVPATATVGVSLTLSGTVVPSNATYKNIVWSVANAGGTGASITGNTLSTTAPGTVTVLATIINGVNDEDGFEEDFTKTFTITVQPVAVTNITVANLTTILGTNLTLSGVVTPTNATFQTIVWSVFNDSNGTGASITGNTLSATATGTVIIRATITNGTALGTNYTQDFTVTIQPVAVTNITVANLTTILGTNLTLSGVVTPTNATFQTIVWSVFNDSNGTGASITGNTLSATATGTVIIRATIANGTALGTEYTQNFTVTIQPVAVTNITVANLTTILGTNLTLSGVVTPTNATFQTIVWSVFNDSNGTGASITGNTLSATATGTVVIRATISNGSALGTNYTQDFTVTVQPVAVTNISDVPFKARVDLPLTLTGTVEPDNATFKTIVWSINNAGTTGATITGGVLTAPAEGTVIVTATIANGLALGVPYTQNFSIEVTLEFVPVENITLANDETILGTNLVLSGTVEPVDATHKTIVWSVFNDANGTGATITGNTLSATAAGTVIIRATITKGLNEEAGEEEDYTQDFTIKIQPVAVTNITVANLTTILGTNLTLSGVVTPTNATFQTIVWSVFNDSNGTGASITGNTLSATATGTVIIRATIANGTALGTNYTQDFTVTVQPVAVTNITVANLTTILGTNLTLSGVVTPTNATFQTIVWSVFNDSNGTGASITGNTLSATATGTVIIRATIANGTALGTNYTQDFTVTIQPVAVTNITVANLTTILGTNLTLSGVVTPTNATFQTIVWSVFNDSNGTGASITGNTLSATATGTVIICATISNGTALGTDYTQNFTVTIQPVAVTNISGVPTTAIVNVPLTLTGTVIPTNATFQTIVWSVFDDSSGTGSSITGNTLSATATGTVIIRATIANGTALGTDYTQNFTITVNIEPVTDIIDVPGTAKESIPLTLSGTVLPSDATYQDIIWSVFDGGTTGATITGNTLNTTAPGTVIVTATIANGLAMGTPFEKNFTILVTPQFTAVETITNLPEIARLGIPLTLSGTVLPSDATNQDIIWSVVNAGTTGATITGNIFNSTGLGVVTLMATIINGAAEGVDFTLTFNVTVHPVAVTEITNIIDFFIVHDHLDLAGTVLPTNATYKNIIWSIVDAGVTGATLTGNVLMADEVGYVTVLATIIDGLLTGTNYTQLVTITVQPIPVSNITDVVDLIRTGKEVELTGTVEPEDASFQTIVWSIVNAGSTGAILNGNIIFATWEGTVRVRATIANGLKIGVPYIQEFDIVVIHCPADYYDAVNDYTYHIEYVAGRCWMNENFRGTKYADGSDIPWAKPYTSAQYPDSEANAANFGLLYTWYSAMNDGTGRATKIQGVCPDGWYMPSAAEWQLMTATDAAALRNADFWLKPNNYTNFLQYDARGAGYYNSVTERFEDLYGYTAYWSSETSENNDITTVGACLHYYCNHVEIVKIKKADAVSVRCILE